MLRTGAQSGDHKKKNQKHSEVSDLDVWSFVAQQHLKS